MKITMIVKQLFARKSADDVRAMKDHFTAAYSDAQLFALVLVGMVLRVFGFVKEPTPGARSLWSIVGMLVKFLQALDDPPAMFRAGPNPLDEMIEDGMRDVGEHG